MHSFSLRPDLDVKTIDKIVMAACILHNFLRRNCNQYIRVGVDIENLEDGNISTGYRANNELLDLQITNQGQSQNKVDMFEINICNISIMRVVFCGKTVSLI